MQTCGIRSNVHNGGATQNLRRLAHSLMQAALANCAITTPWPNSVYSHETTGVEMRERCSSEGRRSLTCYFLPISNCTSKKASSNSSFRFLNANADVSDMIDRVGEKTGLRSELLVMGTLLAWVMRPQPELRAALEQYGLRLGIAGPEARHRYIGMHLRRGDKYSLYSRNLQRHAWRIEPSSFAIWGRRVAANLGMEKVLFMSDDRSIDLDHKFPNLFHSAPTDVTCRPSAHGKLNLGKFVMAGHKPPTSSSVLKSIGSRPSQFGPIMRQVVNQTPACISSLFADDGIQLYAGIMLLAHGVAMIGTQISNVDMAIAELMSTHRYPPALYDVLNDMPRPFLSDERTWFGSSHDAVARPATTERLANGDGTTTRGCWLCDRWPQNGSKTSFATS